MSKKNNLCDVFGQDASYVVLKNKGRVQVFESPSDKTLRTKIKKGWTLVGWVKPDEDRLVLLKVLMDFYEMIQ